jgi:hypothetical protein
VSASVILKLFCDYFFKSTNSLANYEFVSFVDFTSVSKETNLFACKYNSDFVSKLSYLITLISLDNFSQQSFVESSLKKFSYLSQLLFFGCNKSSSMINLSCCSDYSGSLLQPQFFLKKFFIINN